jgi:hypothetical protein
MEKLIDESEERMLTSAQKIQQLSHETNEILSAQNEQLVEASTVLDEMVDKQIEAGKVLTSMSWFGFIKNWFSSWKRHRVVYTEMEDLVAHNEPIISNISGLSSVMEDIKRDAIITGNLLDRSSSEMDRLEGLLDECYSVNDKNLDKLKKLL